MSGNPDTESDSGFCFCQKSHDMRALLSCHLVIYFLWAMEETIAMAKRVNTPPKSCNFTLYAHANQGMSRMSPDRLLGCMSA